MNRSNLVMAAIIGFLAVGIGAFGAHALEAYFEANPQYAPTYDTAVQYQMFAVVGLLAAAALPGRLARLAAWFFVAGVIFFSGSLYALILLQLPIMGAVAPIGGTSFLVGWVLVGVAALRSG